MKTLIFRCQESAGWKGGGSSLGILEEGEKKTEKKYEWGLVSPAEGNYSRKGAA